jgi:hypothetical protein
VDVVSNSADTDCRAPKLIRSRSEVAMEIVSDDQISEAGRPVFRRIRDNLFQTPLQGGLQIGNFPRVNPGLSSHGPLGRRPANLRAETHCCPHSRSRRRPISDCSLTHGSLASLQGAVRFGSVPGVETPGLSTYSPFGTIASLDGANENRLEAYSTLLSGASSGAPRSCGNQFSADSS